MPDFSTFLEKHSKTAREQGIVPAMKYAWWDVATWVGGQVYSRINGLGDRIWDDEWDICVVLDACRADLWSELTTDYPRYRQSNDWGWSVGSASQEWYGQTFDPEADLGVDLSTIGVVSANPFAGKSSSWKHHYLRGATPLHERGFAFVDYVFEDSWGCEVEGKYLDVTHPGDVTDRAWEAWQREDVEKLVVHYMQPHIPFRSRPGWFGKREELENFGEADAEEGENTWKQLRDGNLPEDEFWNAYRDNLEWGLLEVERLREAVHAEILVTSDHGNATGEFGIWGHPPGKHIPSLRRVPWVHVEGAGKENIDPIDRSVDTDDHEKDIEEKLEALGYV